MKTYVLKETSDLTIMIEHPEDGAPHVRASISDATGQISTVHGRTICGLDDISDDAELDSLLEKHVKEVEEEAREKHAKRVRIASAIERRKI